MKKFISLLMITCMVMIPTMVSHAETTSFNFSNVARGSAKQTSVIKKDGWASARIYVGSLGGSEWIYRVRLKSTSGKFVTEQLCRPSTEQTDYIIKERGYPEKHRRERRLRHRRTESGENGRSGKTFKKFSEPVPIYTPFFSCL